MTATLPPENVYGHTKKLRFIRDECERFARETGRRLEDLRMLDFGCGNGSAVSRYLIDLGCRFTGVDIHGPSLEFARSHYAGERAEFVPPDALKGRRFDILVYADVLEHLDNPLDFLKGHVEGLLDPAGLMVGSVPNGYGPFENEKRVDAALGLTPKLLGLFALRRRLLGLALDREDPPYNHDSGHVQFFTKGSLLKLISDAGLEVSTFRNGTFMGAPFTEQTLLRPRKAAEVNAVVADFLPYWAVSTWLFSARPAARDGQSTKEG
jgi:SAM-dependent methyltransferase